MTSFPGEFREAFHTISTGVPAVSEPLKQAMVAMSCLQHILWFSEPGRAKSMLARLIYSIFADAKKLTMQMARDTQKDEIFGAMIAERLIKTGSEEFNLKGGLADVDLFFCDEFFDGPDMLLRMLLTAFLERKFETKDQVVEAIKLSPVNLSTEF